MMKVLHLTTHFTPSQAHTVLKFLDALRDSIWQVHGKAIREHLNENPAWPYEPEEIDDEIPF
jgi:hypothetical protein